ncbi:hypothetical protein HPB51_017325 [Rhipicephalus microplus]|uniref:Uncharacterized protein n=1 Tax=Rhipicephalus microplus TaxID=6941 RepID=A0A9J6ETU0_RHIMP|nr:hypothetical protein HPB51_017325 [Rhipicephalus microplus]
MLQHRFHPHFGSCLGASESTTMDRCFHHAGFQVQEAVPDEEESPADAKIEAVFSEVVPSASFTLQDYESIDESVRTCREETVEEMIAEVQDEDQSSCDECDDSIASVVVAPDRSAKEAVKLLQRYFEHKACLEFLASLLGMGAYLVKKTTQVCQTSHPSLLFFSYPSS